MAFQPVPNTVKIALVGEMFGNEVINTLYFRTLNFPIDNLSVGALCTAVGDWWINSFRLIQSDDYTLQRVTGLDLSTENGVYEEYNIGATGQDIGASMPSGVSFVVKFLTGFSGRSYRGRNYIPGIPTSEVSGNAVSQLFAQNAVSSYETLIDGGLYQPTGWDWVVVSRVQNNAVLPAGVTTAITDVSFTDRTLDSQRRRYN